MTRQAPIAILSALAEEQHGLIALLQAPHCVQRAGREFWCGALSGKPVVLALSRIGKVAAATTTATLIEAFGVGRVVFTGVAGGVGEGIAVGDVVVMRQHAPRREGAAGLSVCLPWLRGGSDGDPSGACKNPGCGS